MRVGHRVALSQWQQRQSASKVKICMAAVNHPKNAATGESKKRAVCERCKRPARVCLCSALPAEPIATRGHVVVLQHPHELKKPLATVPLLTKLLTKCDVAVGRHLKAGQLPILEQCKAEWRANQAVSQANAPNTSHSSTAPIAGSINPIPLYVLFPGRGAIPVDQVYTSPAHQAALSSAASPAAVELPQQEPGQAAQPLPPPAGAGPGGPAAVSGQDSAGQHGDGNAQEAGNTQASSSQLHGCQEQSNIRSSRPAYVLFAVDGTWRQAGEMMRAVQDTYLPPHGPGIRVTLPPPPSPQAAASSQSPPPPSAEETQQNILHLTEGDRQDQGGGLQSQMQPGGQQSTGSDNPNACLLRKEPVEGFVSTHEAVARALVQLEGGAPELLESLLAPLRLMTSIQAQWDPCVRDRVQGKREEESEWVQARSAERAAKKRQREEQEGSRSPAPRSELQQQQA